MIIKNLKAKYFGSSLGILWAIITPLLMMVIVDFVFTHIMKIDLKDFPLFVLSGLLPWFFFAASATEAMTSITRGANLFNQFVFHKEILPLSHIGTNFLNFLIGFITLLPVFIVFKTGPNGIILFIIVPILLQLIFIVGIGLLFAWLNVFIRDAVQLLDLVLMLWFWGTPVFYSMDMVPIKYQWICKVNPMAIYVTMYRDVLFYGLLPSGQVLLIGTVISGAVFLFGYYSFINAEPYIAKKA